MDSRANRPRIGHAERILRIRSAAALKKRNTDLVAAVERLRSAGFPLCAPVRVSEWNGDARSGSFVQIDAATWALHVGRGNYITVDIQRDLNGISPNEAKACILGRSGTVREPDSFGSYNAV
jgi:hypothetical protein